IFALKMGLLKKETLKKQRMIVYGALFTFALFIIPDPSGIAELMLAVSLVILFEFSQIAARFF
ncbi:MAG: twin-arginine translocase subunit TatC, partial [Candidatus Methanoperedens sp.]|nr:twin-arginine translocase subunit TatC [Candidatus Methanoperedens sp.]